MLSLSMMGRESGFPEAGTLIRAERLRAWRNLQAWLMRGR